MKTRIFVVWMGLLLAGTACVSTVSERNTAGVPFVKDKISGRYERPVDQIFAAAKEVIRENGVLVNESILYRTNLVKTIEGKVNQCKVWVRIESIDPKVTEVKVQTRTPGGSGDIDLAAEIEKQIALKLR